MFTREQKIGFFKELLDKFETDYMKKYCEDMIETIPNYIFTMPSSTSLKYHNATQCKLFGQIYHILMFGEILNYRLELEHNKNIFPTAQIRDAIRCVPIFHDAWKCGKGSMYTVHKHPLIAGEWVRNTQVNHDIEDNIKDYIANICERHSGEFVFSNRDKTILPKPENEAEKFCHECDILSSRSNLDMILSDYIQNYTNTIIKDMINTYEFDFGKYKGQTVKSVFNSNPEYFSWMEENGGLREPYKMIIEKLKERERRPEF